MTNPLVEYRRASKEEAKLRRLADAYASERAAVLAEMHRSGMSYGKIAAATGLSRSRVQQLVERGNAVTPA